MKAIHASALTLRNSAIVAVAIAGATYFLIPNYNPRISFFGNIMQAGFYLPAVCPNDWVTPQAAQQPQHPAQASAPRPLSDVEVGLGQKQPAPQGNPFADLIPACSTILPYRWVLAVLILFVVAVGVWSKPTRPN
jgi:hypothetical protein